MKLGDAIAAGYENTGWTINMPYDSETNTACALGLAAIGMNTTFAKIVRGLDDGLWDQVVQLNNRCESYEEMMLRLKEEELDQIEVFVPF